MISFLPHGPEENSPGEMSISLMLDSDPVEVGFRDALQFVPEQVQQSNRLG